MTKDEYISALKRHDWFYEYSDDHSVWRRGSDERSKLYAACSEHDPDRSIWNQYAPPDFQRRAP